MRAELMRMVAVAMLAATLAAAAPKPPAPAAPRTVAAATDGWPDTRIGGLAREWVQAFSKGEAAMRVCLPRILAPESLAKRGVDARMETYRGLHDRFGALMLASVDSSGVGALKVTLVASDLTSHRFTFVAQPQPPYRLAQVLMTETRSGGHGGFMH